MNTVFRNCKLVNQKPPPPPFFEHRNCDISLLVCRPPPLWCVSSAESFGRTFWKPPYLIIFASLCVRGCKVLQLLSGTSMSPDDVEGSSCYQQSRYHSAQQESCHVQLMFRVRAQVRDCWQLCLLTKTSGYDSQDITFLHWEQKVPVCEGL